MKIAVPKAYTSQVKSSTPAHFEPVKNGGDDSSHISYEVDTVKEGLTSSTYRMLLIITIVTSCIFFPFLSKS